MSRLRDEVSQDPVHAEAAALLRSASSNDTHDVMQARVWLRLRTRPRRAPRLLGLRPAAALTLLLLLGALASAAVFRGWRRHQDAIAPVPAPSSVESTRRHHQRRALVGASEMPEAPEAPEPEVLPLAATPTPPAPAAATLAPSTQAVATPAAATPAPPIPARRPTLAAPTPRVVTTAPVAPAEIEPISVPRLSATPPNDDAVPRKTSESPEALLQSAMRALRFEHDAKRAGELADAYLTRYPDDDLVEEAMAIGIEAHEQLADGRAAARAARYLDRYPNGRFRAAALHAK